MAGSAQGSWIHSDVKLRARVETALKGMWAQRALAENKAHDARGGLHMNDFATILREVAAGVGFGPGEVELDLQVEIPGYFRPTKRWDFIVMSNKQLLAAVEFKSIAREFGKNLNNRAEEALGSSTDLWAAMGHGTLGQVRPWVGYFFVIADCEESNKVVRAARPVLPIDEEFTDASYTDRASILCQRMVTKGLYTRAALLTAREGVARFDDSRENLGVAGFLRGLAGHLASYR